MAQVEMKAERRMLPRWWMGGAAASGAACFTQFMDTVKVYNDDIAVHMQTQQDSKLPVHKQTMNIIRKEGFIALNNGLSAAVLRQMVYSTLRFHFYEVVKQRLNPVDGTIPFYQKVMVASVGGSVGGYFSTPADVINVRMQNDVKLPPHKRRNYKHVFDGIWRIYRAEGMRGLFAGASMATGRSVLMTVGQLSFYDQIKTFLLAHTRLTDNVSTHFITSTIAGVIACSLTQPVDVIKTRTMNAKPGEFKSMWHIILNTAKLGPLGFFKGYVLRCVRQVPHTILTFVFFEHLRLNYGIVAA